MKNDRWKTGAFRLHLENGSSIIVEGRLRLQRNSEDGLICDYETDDPNMLLQPRIDQVLSIVRISERVR